MSHPVAPNLDLLVVAHGARIRIRDKHRSDAPDDFQWRRDADIARFDGTAPISLTYSEFLHAFERELAYVDPMRRMFAVDTAPGVHVGNVMYYNADSRRGEAEFGITIGPPEHRGQGIGMEATITFLRYLWETTPFRRVYLHTLEWNDRARACFRRAGFDDVARVFRQQQWFIRMEARREWWLMWDMEGRFAPIGPGRGDSLTPPSPGG